MASNWCELPAEVFHLIFEPLSNLPRWKAYSESLLVCKNWSRQLEPLIYSSVVISTRSQHEKFKGGLVKKIVFGYKYALFLAQWYEITFNNLSRLQHLETPLKFPYLPLIDALIQGKLTELNFINEPVHYDFAALDNYATCVLLLIDRLKNFTLFDISFTIIASMAEDFGKLSFFYKRMSRTMDQSQSFTTLTVRKRISDYITYVESIMKKCKQLYTLHLLIEDDLEEETPQ